MTKKLVTDYALGKINEKFNNLEIPTKVSDLENDINVVTTASLNTKLKSYGLKTNIINNVYVNGKPARSPNIYSEELYSYPIADLTIPTKISDLENDSEFVTKDDLKSVGGKSAYQSWLDLGNEGSEADFISSLHGVNGADGQKNMEIPTYVQNEANRVAKQVLSRQGANTFTIGFLSDIHYGNGAYYNSSTQHACQGFKIIKDKIKMDCVACLGDIIDGKYNDTKDGGNNQYQGAREWISYAFQDEIAFNTSGNHDCLPSNYEGNYFSANEVYARNAAFSKQVVKPSTNLAGGYSYQDFDEKKVRVICLNTSDNTNIVPAVSNKNVSGKDFPNMFIDAQQLRWLGNVALNFDSKENPAEWKFIVISHHSLITTSSNVTVTFKGEERTIKATCIPALRIIKAYLHKEATTFTHEDETLSFDFTSKIPATFIGQVHGHTHTYNQANLEWTQYNTVNGSTVAEKCDLKVPAMSCPNTLNGRESTTVIDNTRTKYTKTVNTANDTSFSIFTFDFDSKLIYEDHYGAGIDLVNTYSPEGLINYTITSNLGNATQSNTATTVKQMRNYHNELSANTGYYITNVIVTMGGTDITSSAYSNNVINIPNVTGDISIIVTTIQAVTYTITNHLTNVVTNNTETAITENTSYRAILEPATDYSIATVIVTMGGTDITSSVYSNGTINIPSVTGDVVITAVAEGAKYTNLLKSAGYKSGFKISSSGKPSATAGKYSTTGYIPVSEGDTVYIKNIPIKVNTDPTLFLFNSSANLDYSADSDTVNVLPGFQKGGNFKSASSAGAEEVSTYSDNTTVKSFKVRTMGLKIAYMRLVGFGTNAITEDSIVTVNEPIE